MKNVFIKTSALILAVSLIGISCKKTLQEKNPSGITDESLFTTPQGFETLVNASYSFTRWWYGKQEGYSIGETGTDLWAAGSADGYPDLTRYLNLQSNNAAVEMEWRNFYAAINLINTGIERIGEAGLTPAIQTTRTAELRFLRAFYNWHIVETWGDVVLNTASTQGIVTTAQRSSVESFYESIFSDLSYAIENLPNTTGDWGRAVKPAAEAMMARVCLTRGRNAEALEYAKKVIDNYNYALVAKYADLWKMENNRNSEVVWAVTYSNNFSLNDRRDDILYPGGSTRGGHNGHLLFTMKYDDQPGMVRDIVNGRPFNRYMPTRYLLDLYNDTLDARYNGSFKSVWFCNQTSASQRPTGMNVKDTAVYCTKYEIEDAVEATKVYRTYDRSKVYNTDGSIKNRLQYVSLSKFDDPTRPDVQQEQSGRDAYVFRLAEMYLIAAEAAFNSGNVPEAVTNLNEIRRRAALPGHETDMEIDAADVNLDFILDERARELAGEQLRWFDLKRTGKLIEKVKAHNPDAAQYIQPFHTVRPIPQSQIDAVTNKNEFKQNTGYQ